MDAQGVIENKEFAENVDLSDQQHMEKVKTIIKDRERQHAYSQS